MTRTPSVRERSIRYPAQLAAALMLALPVAVMNCGGNGYYTEDDFVEHSDAERDAIQRMRHWVDAAAELLQDEQLDGAYEQELRDRIDGARSALAHYDELRSRGLTRTAILAPIRVSAGAIIADDATGVGLGDDALLVPLALAAIATYALTDPSASHAELGQAWNQTLAEIGALGETVDNVLRFAKPGNVADTGIMEEAHALIRARGWRDTPEDVWRALAILAEAARLADDKARRRRIVRTQKARNCVPSRHSKDRKR
ncbi:polymorphic toxin type 34 domain-containing protein [Haliangium sp.]|uniref:polymorphic toxin type 34 domain-containing protein n=1 Tax=Haliangium sp. TaxID=2663208 RepID=UPI003D0FE138